MSYNLDGYVQVVATRIKLFYARYPEGITPHGHARVHTR